MKQGFVYIMASRRNGTIYIGVTSDLVQRVAQHREGLIEGFTKKYGCKTLVWFEAHDDLEQARHRERQMKEWKRLWKLQVIEELNLDWNDLFPSICQGWTPAFAGEQGGSAGQ
jgi:putative endonuclease